MFVYLFVNKTLTSGDLAIEDEVMLDLERPNLIREQRLSFSVSDHRTVRRH